MRNATHLLLLLACASAANAAELTTLAGKKFSGDLVAIDSANAKQLTLKTASGPTPIPLNQILKLDFGGALADEVTARSVLVELVDGSTLSGSAFRIRGKEVELMLYPIGKDPERTVQLPISVVGSILRESQDAKNRLDFQSLVRAGGKRDLLIYREENKLNGTEGTFGPGDDDARKIQFADAASGATRNPNQRSIHGMIFRQPPGAERPQTLCKVVDRNRNVLFAKSISLNDGAVEVQTVAGVSLKYPRVDDLYRFDFASTAFRFLSDVDPIPQSSFRFSDNDENYLKLNAYRRDKNLEGQEIRLGNQRYAKGLSIPAGYDLAYDIGGEFKEFMAVIGVDEQTATDSDVIVTVEADGKTILSQKVLRKDAPKPVKLDVRNVKELRVRVESPPGRLDYGNHVTLADAKVVR